MFLKVKATQGINTVIKAASKVASRYNNNLISSEHILYGLVFNPGSISANILAEFNITSKDVLNVLEQAKNNDNATNKQVEMLDQTEQIFKIAGDVSKELDAELMGTEHLLYALINEENTIANTIIEQVFNVRVDQIKIKLNQVLNVGEDTEKLQESLEQHKQELANSNLPEELLTMGEDLTLKAYNGQIEKLIGREKELERMVQVLCRKSKNNPIITGQAGVGKSAMVEGLAQKIVNGEVPDTLQDKIIYSLEIGSLMAGTRYRGALEDKLKKVVEIITSRPDIILFIDEIHTIMQAGEASGEVSPADMLKPYLARGGLQTIGATTVKEYEKFIEKDKALERRFQPILVNPPSIEDTIKILNGLKEAYESYHNVIITDKAIVTAVNLSERYITERNLPDKAIDLIDEASSKARINAKSFEKTIKEKTEELNKLEDKKSDLLNVDNLQLINQIKRQITYLQQEIASLKQKLEQQDDKSKITSEEIAKVIASWTDIPVNKINQNEKDKLLNLEQQLHKRIIGQEEAVSAVSNAIKRARVGLKDKNRPLGSFIFVGTTGTGKTELCKALAETLFTDENAIIKLDMSEFMESHSVSKLIGAPAGYVGYEEGGVLSHAVKRKPYSVVVFDEIEKAHSDVFNLMLQVLDEGKLTDSKGNVINFKNTLIIFTSNSGADKVPMAKKAFVQKNKQFDFEALKQLFTKSLKDKFKPEFLNRIDQTIVFKPFKTSELAQITKIIITKLNDKLKQKNLSLKLTEQAFKYLINKGTNEEYGARPLRRVIEKSIEDKLTQDLLTGDLQENSTIIIELQDNKLNFKYISKN